jgi:S1-C subfamily serine protease
MTLDRLSNDLADAVADAGAVIVAVHARPRLPSTGVHWQDGVIVTTDGTVRREEDITVTLPDGRRIPATLAGRDRGTDLAALRVPAGSLAPARLGDPSTLRPGNLVLALARLGDDGPRSALGAVSSVGGSWRCWKGGEIDRRLRSDLEIRPGFGGGALIDTAGNVHGINSGALSGDFATTIPVGTVNRVLKQLLERGYVARGWLGVAMQSVRVQDEEDGLVLLSVEPDSPAAKAGLLVGDVILSVDGRPARDVEDVLDALTGDAVGKTVRLEILRGGRRVEAEVLIGERPRRKA